MKVITYPNPDLKDMEYTIIAEDITAGATVLKVINTEGYEVDDYIVIEQVGCEIAELGQIGTIDTVSQITLKAGIKFAHGKLTPIRKTYFNQAKLNRSSDGTTYSTIDTINIKWEDHNNQIVISDSSGSDDYFYQIEYFNSENSLSIKSSPIKTMTPTGYLTIGEFKEESGIRGNDNVISRALFYGAENIKRKLFTAREFKSTVEGTKFELPVESLEFADRNLNGEIDTTDFTVWEEATDGVRTYVTSDISAIDVDRHLITFTNTHPTDGKTLVFEFELTYRKLTEFFELLRRLNTLYAVSYIFRNIPIGRLQTGIGSWSLNGVNINFEATQVSDTVKENKAEIDSILSDIAKVYTRKTRMREPSRRSMSWIKSTLRFE